MRCWRRSLAVALLLPLVGGCQGYRVSFHTPPRPPYKALARPTVYADDLDVAGLRKAADASMEYFATGGKRRSYTLGSDTFSPTQVARSVERFMQMVEETPPGKLQGRLARECRGYKPSKGGRFTAYYEPVLRANDRPTSRYRYPLYEKPDGLTLVRLARFFPGDGRQIHGRLHGGELLPFLTRTQIDGRQMLEGRGLELAWVDDPVALYFLHIQGSGRLRLPDGDIMRVNFAASNGLPYTSIGRYMLDNDIIRSGSSGAIRAYLKANPDTRNDILFKNSRYIFFREVDLADDEGPIGSLGVPLVAGRSIATDRRYVPPGAVMYIKTDAPVIDTRGDLVGWNEIGRFAFSHDSGAAIKGPGRADIYWGEGEYAGAAAGYMNQPGDMVVLMCGVDPMPRAAEKRPAGGAFERVAWPQVTARVATAAGSGL